MDPNNEGEIIDASASVITDGDGDAVAVVVDLDGANVEAGDDTSEAVEIAQIEADRDVTIAAINAEVETAAIEAATEREEIRAETEEEKWLTDLSILTSRVESLTATVETMAATILSLTPPLLVAETTADIPPMNTSSDPTETSSEIVTEVPDVSADDVKVPETERPARRLRMI